MSTVGPPTTTEIDDHLGLSLEQVEGDPWGDPPADASYLVARGHALRRVPLAQLGVEDLRLLLDQSIGAPTLVPLALRVLVQEPLAEGDFYPGDLLAAVLRLDDAHWERHPDHRAVVVGIIDQVDPTDGDLAGTDVPELIGSFRDRWMSGDPNP